MVEVNLSNPCGGIQYLQLNVNNVCDRGIRRTDDEFLYLYNYLESPGILDNTILIITSDHGEFLGENNFLFTHGPDWEECVRIHMIFRYPKLFRHGAVIESRVELLDIMPILLSATGVESPNSFAGRERHLFFSWW